MVLYFIVVSTNTVCIINISYIPVCICTIQLKTPTSYPVDAMNKNLRRSMVPGEDSASTNAVDIPSHWESWTSSDVERYFQSRGFPEEGAIFKSMSKSSQIIPCIDAKLPILWIIHNMFKEYLKICFKSSTCSLLLVYRTTKLKLTFILIQ